MNDQEKKYLKQVITRAIKDGCVVSVSDGEERVIEYSRDADAVLAVMGSVDEEWLYFYNNIGRNYVGTLFLVYGNEPEEVINDMGWPTECGDARMNAIVGEYK